MQWTQGNPYEGEAYFGQDESDAYVVRRYGRLIRYKKGGSSTTVQNSYTPTPGEVQLTQASADYAKKVAPNAYYLNDLGRKLLENSLGAVQVDFNALNRQAQNRTAEAIAGTQGLSGSNQAATQAANTTLAGLGTGQLPPQYQANMEKSIRSAMENTMGKTIAGLGSRGVLNSSVTTEAMSDIGKNAADALARQYRENISQVAGLAQQQLANTQGNNNQNSALYGNLSNLAGQRVALAAAAQEAAQNPAFRAWNASMGLNGATTNALAGVAGKGTSTQTTTQSGGGGFFGGLLGGLVGGAAQGLGMGLFCFPPGAKVKMADGTEKSIEHIEVGDKVMSFVDGAEQEAEVVNVMSRHYADVYNIQCQLAHTSATLTQPFLMEDGTYKTLGDMHIGDVLHGVGTIYGLTYSGERPVHDIEVSGANTYIADGFVVKGGDRATWRE